MKTMTASVASKEFGRYLDSAIHEPVVITKQNRPVVVTVSLQDWEELTKMRVERGINQGLRDIELGNFKELSETTTNQRIALFKDRNSKNS